MTVFQTLKNASSQWQHEGTLRSQYHSLLTDWDAKTSQQAADFLEAQL